MTPLFVLRNIAAVNFYLYAQDFPIAGNGNTVFLGGNGSGKSVLLDAIQIVMTGLNRRYLDLNSRVSEEGRSTRTVREACLGLLDDGEGYQRDTCLTYIALGFEAADGSRRCTAGVCLEAKASLPEENVLGLFLVEDQILRFDDFVHMRAGGGFEEKAWQSFLDEQRRKGRTTKTFPRQNNKAFLRELYAIVNANARGTQLDPDRARAAMHQALSFDIGEITSVTEFVKKFLLDDLPIEIETFQARYTTWREMQKQIVRVEEEIKRVETIRGLTERVMEDQFNAHLWAYGQQRAEYDRYTSVIVRQQQEITALQATLESSQSYQVSLADNIEHSRALLDALKRRIDGTPAYEQIRQAQAEKDRQVAIRRTAGIEAKPIFDALKALHEAVSNPLFPGVFDILVQFSRTHLAPFASAYNVDWPKAPKEISALLAAVPGLAAARQHLEGLHQHALTEKARLARDLDDVERLLKNLKSGGTYMSKDTQEFLADMARFKVPSQSLSEVADIAPALAEWRGIIESVLGEWCDAVIVEPRFMDKAYAHFDSAYKTSRAKLVQSEAVSEADQLVRPGTLAEAVVTDNRYARAFLNVRLGRIVRARSADDIRKGDLAAAIDGKYAHGRGIEYRRLQPIPRLGKSVRDQQIAQLTQSQQTLQPQLHNAKATEARLMACIEALRRAETILISERAQALATLETIATAEREVRRQMDLITDLEAQLPQGLMEEKRSLEADLKACQDEQREEQAKERELIEKIGQRRGGMEANREERKKAADQARAAIPVMERRQARHDPPLGLEYFVRRARALYRHERTSRGEPALVRIVFENLLKDRKASQRSAVNRLNGAISDYVQTNPDQHPGFEWSQFIDGERTATLYDWISLRHRDLTETVLRNFKTQVDKAVLALVETMVHDFLSRLRANIDAVERTKDDLNRALRGNIFMGEVYQIRQERDQDKETIRYLIDRLDIVAPKATALMQSSADPNDPDQVKIKALIDMLTAEGGDDPNHRRYLHGLADYRNYFRFSIDICDPDNGYRKISDLEQRRGKASGGQKFVPFYICLGVAAASAYHNHLGGSKEAPPQSALLLMDEAFEKLDPDNIYKVIKFYHNLGLQLIMAAPKTHQALYQETFDTLISIIRVGRAIQATPQHFHAAAHELLRNDNPMHKPRSFFDDQVRKRENAAE